MLIMDRWLRSIAAAGNVDVSAEIDPCPDEFAHEVKPIPLDACVKECQKVSAEFHAAMKRLGVEQ